MTATADLFKTVLWTDGEGITIGDLNDMQRFSGARLWDQLIQKLAYGAGKDPGMNGQAGANISTATCYALSPGSAYLRQGSANNKVQIAPGTLLQKVAASDGNVDQLLAYTFNGTEEVAIANGAGGGLWRIDLIEMQLAYLDDDTQSRDFMDAITGALTTGTGPAKHQIGCTLQVKSGTAGASPAIPAADAGFVPIAAVLVPPTYAGAAWDATGLGFLDSATASSLLCYDLRMPLRVRPYVVMPGQFLYSGAQAAPDTFKQRLVVSATATVFINCPVTHGRLVGVGLTGSIAGIPAYSLQQYTDGPGGQSNNAANQAQLPLTGASAFFLDSLGNADHFQNHHTPWTGPTVTGGVPLWANGARGPMELQRLSGSPNLSLLSLVLSSLGVGSSLGPAVFWIAEGL